MFDVAKPEPGRSSAENKGFHGESVGLGMPSLEECFVVSVAGVVANDSHLHLALQEHFIPHSVEFVRGLVDAVRNQQPIDPDLIAREELLVRRAVEDAGDEHGTSGFKDSVSWLKQEIVYLSCKPDSDPSPQGQSLVPLTSFELYDPRAYRDGKLTLAPNRLTTGTGRNSIIGADPTFIFDLEPSGLTQFKSIRAFLEQLSGVVPTDDWESFKKVNEVQWEFRFKGCYYAETADGLELILKSPRRVINSEPSSE